jgi:hypothetical protein
MLTEAEQEMLTTLRLDPERLDARNMLGVIYARQGKKGRSLRAVECAASGGAGLQSGPHEPGDHRRQTGRRSHWGFRTRGHDPGSLKPSARYSSRSGAGACRDRQASDREAAISPFAPAL